MMYDLHAKSNSDFRTCLIRSREVLSDSVSGYFQIYLGLGVYVGGSQ